MSAERIKQFNASVARYFGPLVKRFALSLRERCKGVYEIDGNGFVVRIRQGTGHRDDFVVTLAAKGSLPEDINDLEGEIGLKVIAEYHGMKYEETGDYQRDFAEAGKVSEKLLFPYLLGINDDFDGLRQFVDRKAEETRRKYEPFRLPPNVREEWM